MRSSAGHHGVAHGADHGEGRTLKQQVGVFLENHWVETFIIALVFCDIFLVATEAGIDASLLCIHGKEVKYLSPAGQHLEVGHHGGHGGASFLGFTDSSAMATQSATALAVSQLTWNLVSNTVAGLPSLPALVLRGTNLVGFIAAEPPVTAEPAFAPGPQGADARRRQTPHSPKKQHRRHQDRIIGEEHGEEQLSHGDGHDAAASLEDAEGSSDDSGPHGGSGAEGSHGGSGAKGSLGAHEAHGVTLAAQPDVLVCEGAEWHTTEHLLHTCHFWSITILVIFMIEILLKIWCIPGYLDSAWHKLDCTVVTLSLIVDTVVIWYIEEQRKEDQASGMGAEANIKARANREQAELIQGLLVASRVWRIVRIVHGLSEHHRKSQEIAGHGHGHDDTHERSPGRPH
eukprot:TRINITY_DN206_c0_g1_i1.p1 TRINITY_DN206_c0_g1~~TRINITY_DN206_c0_g1_i1.p1  ORF type:complete len:401 (+),score=67.08 TRINITY_DN206_c0_g1_i1:162-1364(+)